MLAYALGRIAVALGLIWVVATLVFLIIHLVPGDPAELLLSQGGVAADPAAVAELRDKLGLNLPIATQYFNYVGGLLRGDLGSSLLDDHSIAAEIALRLPRTLELILSATLLSVIIGLPPVRGLNGFDALSVQQNLQQQMQSGGSNVLSSDNNIGIHSVSPSGTTGGSGH